MCQEEEDQRNAGNHGNRILICGKCGIGKSADLYAATLKANMSQITLASSDLNSHIRNLCGFDATHMYSCDGGTVKIVVHCAKCWMTI